jgi:hypothetical protein
VTRAAERLTLELDHDPVVPGEARRAAAGPTPGFERRSTNASVARRQQLSTRRYLGN